MSGLVLDVTAEKEPALDGASTVAGSDDTDLVRGSLLPAIGVANSSSEKESSVIPASSPVAEPSSFSSLSSSSQCSLSVLACEGW